MNTPLTLTGVVVDIEPQETPFSGYSILWDNGYLGTSHLCHKKDLPSLGDKVTMTFSKQNS